MLHQNQNLQQQEQIKKLEDQKAKLANVPLTHAIRKAIDKKLEVLKTNKPVTK